MKRLITLIFVLMLSFCLIGCGGNQDSEDPGDTSANEAIDIKDMDGLHAFVNDEIYQVAREGFDTAFEITYIDVTDDGLDDAVLVNNLDWDTNIEIVTVNGDRYEHISTNLSIAPYKNEFAMQDGFLKAVQKSGGTGSGIEVMSLLKYDNGRMITVLEYLELLAYEGHENYIGEHTSQINGPLSDFEYILNCDDNGDTYTVHKRYTYDEKTLSYEETTLEDEAPQNGEAPQNSQQSQTSNGEVITYKIDREYWVDLNKDGQPDSIIYSNWLNEIALIINEVSYALPGHDAQMTAAEIMAVDVDGSDKSVEIILSEAYPPEDDCLTFYRYDGNSINSCGRVMIGYSNGNQNDIAFDGQGGITVEVNSQIMYDGIYDQQYMMGQNGDIECMPSYDLHYYKEPIISTVHQTIRGYQDKTTDQSFMEIQPGEEIVIYGEIDNWLNIKWQENMLWINDNELTHFTPDADHTFEFDGIRFWS